MPNGKQAERLRFEFMRFIGMDAARAWDEFLKPVPFDEVVITNTGVRVRVRIERFVSVEDTQPVRSEA